MSILSVVNLSINTPLQRQANGTGSQRTSAGALEEAHCSPDLEAPSLKPCVDLGQEEAASSVIIAPTTRFAVLARSLPAY